jgi:hypothetical protein
VARRLAAAAAAVLRSRLTSGRGTDQVGIINGRHKQFSRPVC